MYRKLAFRNMKRQMSNYLIYFITIALTIALVFAMNNLIYNEDLQARADSFASLAVGLLVLSSFLCVIIAFVLGYANRFMLRLRTREFGTYLTVGMKRHQIVKLFLFENSFLGLLALVVGGIFGSILYQALMLLMSSLLEYDFAFSFFSLKGIVVTLLMVVSIFAVTFLTSSIYLSRITIFELLHGEKKVNHVKKAPLLSGFITVLAGAGIVYAFSQFSYHIEGIFENNADSATGLLLMIVVLAVSVILFHYGLAKCLMYALLQQKKWSQQRTNRFILRQLSATLNANAMLLGLLAFLMTFSIIAANVGFLYKAVEEENLERRFPFDIRGNLDAQLEPVHSYEEIKQQIAHVTTIEQSFETPVFTTGQVDFLKETHWYDEDFTDTDAYVRESDFNQLLDYLGEPTLDLQQQFAIYSDSQAILNYDFSQHTLEQSGQRYTLSQVEQQMPTLIWAYFVIVVPDELVEDMTPIQTAYALDVADTNFDVAALNEAFSYEQQYGQVIVKRSDFDIKEYERVASLAFSAILILGALYMSFVFVLLAMAILALKTLSAISEDARKYTILFRLGVSKQQQTVTLAKQIFLFFAFPIIIPLLLAVPVTMITEKFIKLLGFHTLSMSGLSISIICIMSFIYFIYYAVTFSITKKYVIR
ncbi:MAG: ABC transporter permease [Solibacillus sp.]